MQLTDIMGSLTPSTVVWIATIVLSLIQVAPIKVNPWTAICRTIGHALNGEVIEIIEFNEAKTARYRMLRFDDEIRHHIKHSEEHFNQIIEDIETYEKYCKEHPNYKNNKAVFAIENIMSVYKKCKDEKSFLI